MHKRNTCLIKKTSAFDSIRYFSLITWCSTSIFAEDYVTNQDSRIRMAWPIGNLSRALQRGWRIHPTMRITWITRWSPRRESHFSSIKILPFFPPPYILDSKCHFGRPKSTILFKICPFKSKYHFDFVSLEGLENKICLHKLDKFRICCYETAYSYKSVFLGSLIPL